MRAVGRIGLLVVLWLLAWGQVSLGNVVSGMVVAAALLLVFPLARPAARGAPVSVPGMARLAVYVAVQLVTSNVVMAKQILRPRPHLRPGVLAHRLRQPSDAVVTLMTGVIALSPGTMTVDVAPDSSVVYVHFLLLHDVDAARTSLARLERMAARALGGVPSDPLPSPLDTKE